MLAAGPNPEMIRVVLIILFFAIMLLRARKSQKSPRPTARGDAAKAPQLGEALREAMRQASEQRARQGGQTADGEMPMLSEQPFQQPPAIQPESTFLPSILLLALVACLCLMVYRYWAG